MKEVELDNQVMVTWRLIPREGEHLELERVLNELTKHDDISSMIPDMCILLTPYMGISVVYKACKKHWKDNHHPTVKRSILKAGTTTLGRWPVVSLSGFCESNSD